MAQKVDLQNAPRIGPDEARERFDRGEAVFVDVRGREFYERSRVPGAMWVRLQELGQRLGDLPRDKMVIFY